MHRLARQRDDVQQLLGVRTQRAAGGREGQAVPLPATLEEPYAQRILERADARADRRLRQAQRSGGPAEAAERPDGQERFDLRDFHECAIPE